MKVIKETGERILIRNNEVKEDCFLLMIFHIKIAYYVHINIIQLITIIIFFMKKMNIIHYLKTILTQRLLLEI